MLTKPMEYNLASIDEEYESMTRCKLLDEWFDAKSKEVDDAEEKPRSAL